MAIDIRQMNAATERYHKRSGERTHNERLISERRYLQADDPARVEKFLTRRGYSAQEATALVSEPAAVTAEKDLATAVRVPDPLERILGTNDLLGVAFLQRGVQVARSIGRVWVSVAAGRPQGYGTGFLISPRLLMTNNHVLPSASVARTSLIEFNYQLGFDGHELGTQKFDFDPDAFFFTDQHLDYAVVAVRFDGDRDSVPTRYGWNPLIETEGKAIVSQFLNIIQHPNGEVKQLCLRENQLVDVLDDFLQYKTDTAPGSSGSPVYNDRWELVGLHHSGVPEKNAAGQILADDGRIWDDTMGEQHIKWIANEGIRVSRLVAHLRNQNMTAEQKQLFQEVFVYPPVPRDGDERAFVAPSRPEVAGHDGSRVDVSPDGTATWTIPLSVSVKLGGVAAAQPAPADALPPLPAVQPVVPVMTNGDGDPKAVLSAARHELASRDDVLNVRLGYVFKDGWITDERALVVTVRQKRSIGALREANVQPLPTRFMGFPVEVTNPTVEDLVKIARGPQATESIFPSVEISPNEITYTPLADVPLQTVTANMRVIAHVSPDAGWTQLSGFLAGVRKRLVVGMYDFGAPHIADRVEAAGQGNGFKKLTLVMQRGESVGDGTKADDLTDDEVVDKLSSTLGNRFENAWVKIGRINGWVASSYHIKVAVRDDSAFWLSSGNWQSSNQPKADPLNEDPQRRVWLDKYNREWHAIVEGNAGLAGVFEKYLLHDFSNNVASDGQESIDLPDLLIPDEFFAPELTESTGAFRYFAPFDDNREFTVTPLLTPDNFHEEVLRLVRNARDELLIQNQTFNAPGANHTQLRELIDAVIDKQRSGVKVRVIFRVLLPSKARQVIEELKDYGFDVDDLKVQRNCHTKGVIVDRKHILLGSQNWSNDGVSVNRDASLLFSDDEPLASYFAEIFEHDWNNLARRNIGRESMPVEWTEPADTTPSGWTRLNWKDYLEMQ